MSALEMFIAENFDIVFNLILGVYLVFIVVVVAFSIVKKPSRKRIDDITRVISALALSVLSLLIGSLINLAFGVFLAIIFGVAFWYLSPIYIASLEAIRKAVKRDGNKKQRDEE